MPEESIEIWDKTITNGIQIEKIVITHAHPDHLGLAKWFQENHHIPIITSDLTIKKSKKERINRIMLMNSVIFRETRGTPVISEDKIKNESFVYHFEPDEVFEKRSIHKNRK